MASTLRSIDMLISDGVLITLDPERRIFMDGAIAVHGGVIIDAGKTRDLAVRYSPSRRVHAGGGVIQPGFVDAHVHLATHLHRSVLVDSWPHDREHEHYVAYRAGLSDDDAYRSALLACMEMLRNGTTCFSDLGMDYDIGSAAAEAVGIRGMIAELNWDQPGIPGMAHPTTDEVVVRLENRLRASPPGHGSRTWAGAGSVGLGRSSDSLVVATKELADQFQVRMYMHQSFADDDTRRYIERTGARTATEHLDRLGVLDANLQLIHMNRADDAEVARLAEVGAHIVHCPAASLRMGLGASRVGRFPEMMTAGVNVALGSDSGNFSDSLDVGRQAYLAATIHREARGVVPSITAEQALEMATINGARAIGAAREIGSIEVGKQADIVLHSTDLPEWHPGLDPVLSLIYSAGSASVDTVIVGGEVVVERGELVRLDERAELRRIDDAAHSLYERIDYRIPARWPVLGP